MERDIMVTKWIIKNRTFMFVFFMVFLFLTGCVSTEKRPQSSDLWMGDITGGVKGKIKLFSWVVKDDTGIKKVESKISVETTDSAHYTEGTIKGTISGKIENNALNAIITGHAYIRGAMGKISGTFTGNMSEFNGSGELIITVLAPGDPKFKGNWLLEKQ
jgi:hypothetical protein